MANPTTLFIVEGEKRDVRFLNSLIEQFMPKSRKTKTLVLSAAQNIYMLCDKLEKDDFETDVVEILRESNSEAARILKDLRRDDIDEIFLFFDFDPHHFKKKDPSSAVHQVSNTLKKMLKVFDNETEFGKLYISYPMVEALYDYAQTNPLCKAYSKCYLPLKELTNYKQLSGNGNPIASEHQPQWSEVLNVYTLRIACLFGFSNLHFVEYRNCVTPLYLYRIQKALLAKDKVVFVLSALPEFLFDYFGEEFWNDNVNVSANKSTYQSRRQLLPYYGCCTYKAGNDAENRFNGIED